MRIYRDLADFKGATAPVVTTGTFDGVHLGHRKIIARMKEIAGFIGGETLIITFFPHPRMILHPEDTSLKLLNTIEEKVALLEDLGVDHLIVTPFTRDFSNMSYEAFIEQVLVSKIGTRKLVIGYDHHFGKDRKGDLGALSSVAPRYGFDVEEISVKDLNNIAISSTKIRQALFKGDVASAQGYLGYAYTLSGTVMLGDQLGRTLGFPTANLLISEPYKLIPGDGIYAVRVRLHKQVKQVLKGMLYIGNRPVVNGMNRSIEVNIFDFNEDIYSQSIELSLISYIRGDENFANLEEMKGQMELDKHQCLSILN